MKRRCCNGDKPQKSIIQIIFSKIIWIIVIAALSFAAYEQFSGNIKK